MTAQLITANAREDAAMVRTNRYENVLRAEWYARADYYADAARRPFLPVGNDPVSGKPWRTIYYGNGSIMARKLARASYAAMARVAYANARAFPSPMPS